MIITGGDRGRPEPPGWLQRARWPYGARMNLQEFQIGQEFWCGARRWRCTDVGTRVVAAICLEPHEVVEVSQEAGERRYVTDDPSWFNGPPYAVAETLFDEDDQRACSKTPET
jgi:hypothetical protein